MGKEELKNQRKLLETALQHADDATLHAAIDGTLGDAQSFCWAAQEQFRRLWSQPPISESPRINAQFSADLHILLEVLSVTVDHVAWLERLLNRRGEAVRLPPTDGQVRKRVKQARNLLAAHRDERVVYRRLTAEHTPHVLAEYSKMGLDRPLGSIDSIELDARATVGAGLLSLDSLEADFSDLDDQLGSLRAEMQSRWAPG